MQHEEKEQIRRAWGDKPCDHPSVDKEYYFGADTGDKVCTQCGRVVEYMGGSKKRSDNKDGK